MVWREWRTVHFYKTLILKLSFDALSKMRSRIFLMKFDIFRTHGVCLLEIPLTTFLNSHQGPSLICCLYT